MANEFMMYIYHYGRKVVFTSICYMLILQIEELHSFSRSNCNEAAFSFAVSVMPRTISLGASAHELCAMLPYEISRNVSLILHWTRNTQQSDNM